MRQIGKRIWKAFMNGDKILLLLCLVASSLGCIAIASATSHHETLRYLFIQVGAICIGVVFYVLVWTMTPATEAGWTFRFCPSPFSRQSFVKLHSS